MKKFHLSIVLLTLHSTYLLAGGSMKPVEPVIDIPTITVEEVKDNTQSGFYVGLGYSCMQYASDTPDYTVLGMSSLSAIIGYNVTDYIGIEGRYTTTFSDLEYEDWEGSEDLSSSSMSSYGIYLKPKYALGQFGVYGLLGFGGVTIDNGESELSDSGLQYGAGINFMLADNMSIFMDYRRLYDDTGFDGQDTQSDIALNSWTTGVNYSF